jgi:hypothetical protein
VDTNTSILKAGFHIFSYNMYPGESSAKDRRENDGQIELESKGKYRKRALKVGYSDC